MTKSPSTLATTTKLKRPSRKFVLILISGPPRSGKNRAGACLGEHLDADHFALSDYLKRKTHSHYGLAEESPIFLFESRKDTPCQEFNGLTPREAYIDYSERIIKPQFGPGYLGELACRRVEDNSRVGRISVVSGVGFLDEVLPLVNVATPRRTLHIELEYPTGSSLRIRDSREQLDLVSIGVKTATLVNVGCDGFIQDFTGLPFWN